MVRVAARLSIGGTDTGVMFKDSADNIIPWNTGTNGSRDGAISLGEAGGRFKDLYLSGGVYLGGTGAANKLHDYEEGTWTPTSCRWLYTHHTDAQYVKIGRQVTL